MKKNMNIQTLSPHVYAGLDKGNQLKYMYNRINTNDIISEIALKVCKYFNVNISDVLSSSRVSNIVKARQISMYFVKTKLKCNDRIIGEYFLKDRTTVIHSVNLVSNMIYTYKDYRLMLNEIEDIL